MCPFSSQPEQEIWQPSGGSSLEHSVYPSITVGKVYKVGEILRVSMSILISSLFRLFMHGADLSVCDYDQRTALHVAACEGHIEVVRFLVDVAKVDIHAKDRYYSYSCPILSSVFGS